MEKNIYMTKPILRILALPLILLVVGLACNLSSNPTSAPPVPTSPEVIRTVAPTTTPIATQDLEQVVKTAQAESAPGKVEITVTQAQITDYITKNLSEQYSSVLSNPVVTFQPGQVVVTGTVQASPFTADGKVVMTVDVDPQGQPQVNIVEANFGPIPIPAGALSNLSDAVDRSIADAMKDYQSEYRLESITFSTGQAKIVLVKK